MTSWLAIWVIAGVSVGGIALLVWTVASRGKSNTALLARVVSESAAARQASEAVDRRFEDLRRALEGRVEGVERRLAEGQRHVAEHLGQSGRMLQDVGEKMGRLYEASQKIERLAGDVTRLEELLKPPKLRGALGETFLEQALAQVLPRRCWQMQYRFGDAVVDAAIFFGERLVAVDSKFPLDNWRRARESADENDRRRAGRDFAADVRRHVDSIRAKYVRPDAGTCDFALMYVPAEAVYAEIASDEAAPSLADYAVERRVIPVSPRLLFAYLSTVAMGLRGLELQQSAQEVGERLADLARHWDKAAEPFEKLGTHLAHTQKQYEQTARALERFGSRLTSVAETAGETLETEPAALPLLPAS